MAQKVSDVAEYNSLSARAQSRGSLSVPEEMDISHGLTDARERSVEESIAAQRQGGRFLDALGEASTNAQIWEALTVLSDQRTVDFLRFTVPNKHGYGIKDPNYNGMKYTLSPDFVAYLDGQARSDKALLERQERAAQRAEQWRAEIQQEHKDLLTAALDDLWRTAPKLAVCVYQHCFLRQPLDAVAPLVGLKTGKAVSRRVSAGLDLMRSWVAAQLNAKFDTDAADAV